MAVKDLYEPMFARRPVKGSYAISQALGDAFKEQKELQNTTYNELINRYLAEGIERDRKQQAKDMDKGTENGQEK